MEKFSLEKYLENPNRKVVTRQGKSVRIICTDRRHTDNWPIVALEDYGDGEFVIYANIDGRTDMCSEDIHDLFFADEEEELTQFEKAIKKLIESCCNEVEEANITNAGAKEISSHILDLARKELTKNLPQKNDPIFELLEIFGEWLEKNGYSFKFPKSDTLKDLPKWKRVPKTWKVEDNAKVVFSEDYKYYIDKKELFKKLQKE